MFRHFDILPRIGRKLIILPEADVEIEFIREIADYSKKKKSAKYKNFVEKTSGSPFARAPRVIVIIVAKRNPRLWVKIQLPSRLWRRLFIIGQLCSPLDEFESVAIHRSPLSIHSSSSLSHVSNKTWVCRSLALIGILTSLFLTSRLITAINIFIFLSLVVKVSSSCISLRHVIVSRSSLRFIG